MRIRVFDNGDIKLSITVIGKHPTSFKNLQVPFHMPRRTTIANVCVRSEWQCKLKRWRKNRFT